MARTSFKSVARISVLLGALLSSSLNTNSQNAEPKCISDAMLVFDGSGSMAELGFNGLNRPRILDARQAIREVIPEISKIRRLGLIIYGPGPDDCGNVDLRFRPTANAGSRVIHDIDTLTPNGTTPLTSAVREAARALSRRGSKGVVVLLTDGRENCGGMPCQLAGELSNEGFEATVHVIGFKVRKGYFSWRSTKEAQVERIETPASCLAEHTGGHHVSTETVDELTVALRKMLGCPLIG